MKYVREHINEKFTEDSDPIQDMGIGIASKFKDFYKKFTKYGFREPSAHNLIIAVMTEQNFSANEMVLLFQYIKKRYHLSDKYNDVFLQYASVIKGEEKSYIVTKYILDNFNTVLNDINRDENDIIFVECLGEGNYKTAELLFEKVIIIAKDTIDIEVEYNNKKMIKWLFDHGAKCNLKDYQSLRNALDNDNFDVVDMCIKQHYEQKYKK